MTPQETLDIWAQELARQDAELETARATLRSLGNVQLQINADALAEIDTATEPPKTAPTPFQPTIRI
jgi:hypothetical protein